MDLSKLTLGEKIAGGTSIVLFIGLLFFPWHSVDLGSFGDYNRKAMQSPGSFWGVLAFLLTIVVIATIVLKVTGTKVSLPVPMSLITFGAAALALLFLLLKLVLETDYLGWGAWFNLLLAAGMTYGGFLVFKEGGGDLKDIKASLPKPGPSPTGSTPPPPPPPPPPPAV